MRQRTAARVINVDGHPAYASGIAELRQTGDLGRRCSLPNGSLSEQQPQHCFRNASFPHSLLLLCHPSRPSSTADR
jgi:hypothetical protein